MMNRLQAREHLDAIRVQGIAYGGYKDDDSNAMLDELRDKAAGIEREDVEAGPVKASPEMLAAMGIGVVSSQKAVSDE